MQNTNKSHLYEGDDKKNTLGDLYLNLFAGIRIVLKGLGIINPRIGQESVNDLTSNFRFFLTLCLLFMPKPFKMRPS